MQPAVFWAARAVSAELIERLAADLRASFPGALGLSRRNLQYMRAFAEAWPEEVQQAGARLPWSHIVVLLDRLDDTRCGSGTTRDAAEGWSRAVVETMVGSWLHLRSGPGAVELSGDLARRRLRPGAGDHTRPRVPAPLPPCWTPGLPPTTSSLPPSGCRSTSPSPVWTVLPVGFELVVGACQCPATTVRSHACSA